MKRIILIGFMGAGKSTVGKELARALSCPFVDTDEQIEKEQEKKISEIFEKEGEKAFRDMETELLKKLQYYENSFVLSVGGGLPMREENRKLLREIGCVIYLNTSKKELLRRLSGDKNRPLLQGGNLEEKVSTLIKNREEIYKETAHKEVFTDGKFVSALVEEIVRIN